MYPALVSVKWLKDKIDEKLELRKTKKIAFGDLEDLSKTCHNYSSRDELKKILKHDYTHYVATVDNNDKVVDVEVIRDTSTVKDKDVAHLINRTGEGMVIFTK